MELKNFVSDIRSRLEERRGAFREVADQSGVSYSWISKFVNGHIPSPRMVTLTKIHDALHAPEVPKH